MKRLLILLLVVLPVSPAFTWGFFAHRMINRLAVFALPEQLMGFYKENIEFITEHAVDPDKRRYAVKEEAARHYIDLDHYEVFAPVDTVPKRWKDAIAKYSEDTLLAYGIVPWHVNTMMYRLTDAFKERDSERILKTSTEIGHYIADAHVPLHATENYNGQMTGQHGIHGFWESRLPELYSDEYDFFVGRAYYVQNVLDLAWMASGSSFAAKDSVLNFERELNAKFPSDRKFVMEQKGQTQIKAYSKEYSLAFNRMLGGQVERRMRLSILAVASVWYTAWVDAGQPDISSLKKQPKKLTDAERKALVDEEKQLMQGRMIGREE
jgi:hypothetical protein